MTLALPGPLVDVAWLARHLDHPDLVVLDASTPEAAAPEGVPGALRYDLEGDFSDPASPLPHTEPSPERSERALRALGVRQGSTVVVYDAQGLYSAPRAWWYARAVGVERIAVLDGGLPAWRAAGHPTAPLSPPPGGGDVEVGRRPGLVVGADQVAAALRDPDAAVLDARSGGRFRGEDPEPRPGLRGGHAPGAVSLPFTDVQRDGRLLPPEELRVLLRHRAADADRLVLSCGSGVTACVLALAATVAGHHDVAVYDGSWSEWGRADSGRPVVQGP